MTEKTWVFKKEEIFSETDEKGMVTMKIPKEISDKKGWVVGDNLKMSVGDQGTIIIEKLEEQRLTNINKYAILVKQYLMEECL